MAIILLIKMEDGEVTELPLLNKISLGRSSSSDFQIQDNKISGVHCTFEITPRDQVMFTDLGSSNGSYCNNNKITKALFKINDSIRIGNTVIKIEVTRLTYAERRSIGTSSFKKVEEKSLLPDKKIVSKKESHSNEDITQNIEDKKSENNKESVTKRRVGILDIKIARKVKAAVDFSNADTIHEQEPSTGNTKFLKLEKNTTKKKKP